MVLCATSIDFQFITLFLKSRLLVNMHASGKAPQRRSGRSRRPTRKCLPVSLVFLSVLSFISFQTSTARADVSPCLNEDLVAYYTFDTNYGDVAYDASGLGNDATIVGATWATGRYESGLSFDGINDYVNCGTLGNYGSTALGSATTYAFWLKTSQTGSSRVMGTVNNGYTTALAVELNIPETDKLSFYLRDNETKVLSGSLKDSFDFTGTGWHHFAFIIEAQNSNLSFYIDGAPLVVTYTQQESPNAFSDFDYPFLVGAWNHWRSIESFIEGIVDEVRIYNRALSLAEVKSLASIRHVVIDQSFVSDERADLGSTQKVGFHAKWGHNGSDVAGGTISVERQKRNGDYSYHTREIRITEMSGDYLLDYQVLVEIDTAALISDGKMRSDGADIRFKDSDGETDLSYWIEGGLNTSSTRIWVKVPLIPGSSTKRIYLSYGNASANSASNIKETFLLGDDFEDGVLDATLWTWVRESPGNWDEGVATPGWLMMRTLDGAIWWWPDGSVLRTKMDFRGENYDATVQVRISPTENFHQANLFVYSDDRHHLRLGRGFDGDQRVEFSFRSEDSRELGGTSMTATDLLLRITKMGKTYTGYLSTDSGRSWSMICEYKNVSLENNYIALMSTRDHNVGAPVIDTYYDNMRVRRLVLPEPLVFVGEEDSVLRIDKVDYITDSTGWVTFSVSSPDLGEEFWIVAGVDAAGVTTFYRQVGDLSIVWDQVDITLTAYDGRIDIGREASISYDAVYLYDGETFQGTVSFNDTVLTQDQVGGRAYKTSSIVDSKYGLSAFATNEVRVVWDRVNISLSISNIRTNIGSEADVAWEGFYEYDRGAFSGSVLLNDTLIGNVAGERGFTVDSVIDPLHNLTAFASNEVQCIFDEIEASHSVETLALGSILVTVNVNFGYDGSPVEDALVRVNGVEAENVGNGLYQARLSSWMPFVTMSIELVRAGYELVKAETVVCALGNIVVEAAAVSSVVGIAAFSARKTGKKDRAMTHQELRLEGTRPEKSRLGKLEALLEERRWVSMKEASEITGVEIANIKELFSDLMKRNRALQGFFVDDVFVVESVEER